MQLVKLKLALSLKSTAKVLSNWRYSLLAALIAVLFIQLIYWLLNLSLFWFFITTNSLNILEKFDVFYGIITSYIASLPLWQAVVLVLLAVIQGIVISVLIFTIKRQNTIDKKAISSSTIASIIAMFSVGCVSCGTSIITPIVGLFVSSASVSLGETINKFATLFGLIVATYALYAVGLAAANVQARIKQQAITQPSATVVSTGTK